MKKGLFWLFMLLLLGYGAAHLKKANVANKTSSAVTEGATARTEPAAKEEPMKEDKQNQESALQKNELTLKITNDQIYKGNLLLVNQDHRVPKQGEASEELNLYQHKELVKGFGLLDSTIQASPDLVEKFTVMIRAAAKQGVRHFIINSGYRDAKEQSQLYRQMGADYAMPAGYSEHNLGLSLDIGSTQGEMNQAAEGKWLVDNAWKYGFVLRYPKDKTAITGIQYEPWHFRYVGLPHSAIMHEKNFVLEQYLDFLKSQKTVSIAVDHQTYEISYYPVSGNAVVHVPANRRYELSGNNMDGVIVTVYP
jgi:D-alanyl-D-alanine carboxypeptidase